MTDTDRLAAECDCHRYNFAHHCPHHGYVTETNPGAHPGGWVANICPDPDAHALAAAVRRLREHPTVMQHLHPDPDAAYECSSGIDRCLVGDLLAALDAKP